MDPSSIWMVGCMLLRTISCQFAFKIIIYIFIYFTIIIMMYNKMCITVMLAYLE